MPVCTLLWIPEQPPTHTADISVMSSDLAPCLPIGALITDQDWPVCYHTHYLFQLI